MHNLQNTGSPALILVRGIPGSGKSYLAAALQRLLGADKTVMLDPDAIEHSSQEYQDFSKGLTTEGVDEKLHPYRFLRSKAHQAIVENKTIIWTQGFTDLHGFSRTILNLQTYASDHGRQLPLLVVEVEVDEATARMRAAQREAETGRAVPDEAFARFIKDYISFADQGYNTVVVNGEDDVAVSVETVREALEKLLRG